jgi:hypothetical protein
MTCSLVRQRARYSFQTCHDMLSRSRAGKPLRAANMPGTTQTRVTWFSRVTSAAGIVCRMSQTHGFTQSQLPQFVIRQENVLELVK